MSGEYRTLSQLYRGYLPEDYRERSLNYALKQSALPSVFSCSGAQNETEAQDCNLKDESSSAQRVSHPEHEFPLTDQQHSTSTSSACPKITGSELRHQKVFSKKEMTPAPLSSCSEVEEKSWRKAVKSIETCQETNIFNIFRSNEVLVNTQCLLELFQYCWLCQIECCITIEGHEKQFSITQDCQSCGHHKKWRSHPSPGTGPAETLNTQQKASCPDIQYTKEPGAKDRKEVVVHIASTDDEDTEQNCKQRCVESDGSYLSSTEEETSEQDEMQKKKKGKRKSKNEDSSDEWEPHVDEMSTDSDASMDGDGTLTEDGQGKVVMWCTVCNTDATLSCSLHRHKKVFVCAQCGSGDNVDTHNFEKVVVHFEDFPSFQKHAEKEHGAKSFRKLCQECGMVVLDKLKSGGSKEHICEHKTKPIVCPQCGKRFLTEVGLKRHYSKLHKDADHPCKYCLKLFRNRPAKLEHEHTHPKEKQPYSCPDCPERFDNIYRRNSHLRFHRGPCKYGCDTCGKRFRDIIKLKRHKLVHSGEKQFKCQVCDRSFNQIGNLSSHMRLHTGEKPFMCEQCGECFNHNVSLKNHLMRYHYTDLSPKDLDSKSSREWCTE